MAGVIREVFEDSGLHMVVARTETDFRTELLPGRLVVVRSRFVAVGTKSVTYEQELKDADSGHLHATQRAVEVFFDPKTRASAAVPAAIRALLSG